MYLLIPVVSAAIASLLIFGMLRLRLRLPLDHPNARSLHHAPVPRIGGVALLSGSVAACAIAVAMGGPIATLPLVLGVMLAVPSFIDDWRSLPPHWRLLFHVIGAGAFVAFALSDLALWAQALAVIAVAWMTNLYNFMDGADGLAGGMAAIGFGCLAWAAIAAGDTAVALTCLALAGGAAGFLAFNFHPAKVFMGDTGSIPLGFLAAGLTATGWAHGDWPAWFGAVVFSPFIADASVTLVKRLVRRERVWEAHREHYYQRLVRRGWSHRRTALAEYALMVLVGGIALLALRFEPRGQIAVLCAVAGFYAVLMLFLEFRLHAREAGHDD